MLNADEVSSTNTDEKSRGSKHNPVCRHKTDEIEDDYYDDSGKVRPFSSKGVRELPGNKTSN
jgi:hypothetical protein